jgi:hypothetical protein
MPFFPLFSLLMFCESDSVMWGLLLKQERNSMCLVSGRLIFPFSAILSALKKCFAAQSMMNRVVGGGTTSSEHTVIYSLAHLIYNTVPDMDQLISFGPDYTSGRENIKHAHCFTVSSRNLECFLL